MQYSLERYLHQISLTHYGTPQRVTQIESRPPSADKLTWYIVVWRFDSCGKVCVLGYGMSVVIQRWQLWQDI